jgi:hypothetical protein
MHLWDYDKKQIQNTTKGIRFQLERMINFGTNGKRINKTILKKHFPFLHLDPKKKEFLKFLLWNQ